MFVVGMVKNSAIFFAVFQEEFESTSQQTGWIGSIMASLSIAAGMKPKKKAWCPRKRTTKGNSKKTHLLFKIEMLLKLRFIH